MVLPGSIEDASWNQAGYEALREAGSRLGLRVTYTDRVGPGDARRVLESYAGDGVNLIVAHGNQYGEIVAALAPLYPRSDIVVVGNLTGNSRNLGAADFYDSESYFLAGALAGLASERGRVALLVGEIYPHEKPVVDLFRQGAEWARSGTRVEIRSLGGWEAFDTASREATTLIDAGFDVLVANVDEPGAMLHRLADERGVRMVGWRYGGEMLESEALVGHVQLHLDRLLLETARLSLLGRLEGRQYLYGVQQGMQELKYREEALPPAAVSRLQALHRALEIGKMQVSQRHGAHFVESPVEVSQPWPQSASPDKP